MASVYADSGITWSAAGTVSLNSTARFDSDAVTLNVEDWDCSIHLKADNSGTPASGDVVDVYVKWSLDGTNFDTNEFAEYIGRLDTVAANTPGEDPCEMTLPLMASGKKAFKLSVVAAQGATRAITFSARFGAHRPQ